VSYKRLFILNTIHQCKNLTVISTCHIIHYWTDMRR